MLKENDLDCLVLNKHLTSRSEREEREREIRKTEIDVGSVILCPSAGQTLTQTQSKQRLPLSTQELSGKTADCCSLT